MSQQPPNKALHSTAYSSIRCVRSSLRSLRFRRRVSLVVIPKSERSLCDRPASYAPPKQKRTFAFSKTSVKRCHLNLSSKAAQDQTLQLPALWVENEVSGMRPVIPS